MAYCSGPVYEMGAAEVRYGQRTASRYDRQDMHTYHTHWHAQGNPLEKMGKIRL